eukprot:5568543-Prymnesium_polylepis.1
MSMWGRLLIDVQPELDGHATHWARLDARGARPAAQLVATRREGDRAAAVVAADALGAARARGLLLVDELDSPRLHRE